jgi:hypothetical protein
MDLNYFEFYLNCSRAHLPFSPPPSYSWAPHLAWPTCQPPLSIPLFPCRHLATRRARHRSPVATRAAGPTSCWSSHPFSHLAPLPGHQIFPPLHVLSRSPLVAQEAVGPPSSPSISSTLDRLASLQRARELPPPPADTLRPFGAPATVSPSTKLIGAPPSPPSLVRTAARTHPSSLFSLIPPLTYPVISPTCRVDAGLPPPLRAVRTPLRWPLPATSPTPGLLSEPHHFSSCSAHPSYHPRALTLDPAPSEPSASRGRPCYHVSFGRGDCGPPRRPGQAA